MESAVSFSTLRAYDFAMSSGVGDPRGLVLVGVCPVKSGVAVMRLQIFLFFFWVLLKNGSFFFLVGFKRKIPHGFGYLKYFKSLELNLIVSFPMTMVKV